MLDRYLSLDGEEREKFISDYYYRESIVYNSSTEKYTVSNQYNHYGPVTLVAKRIGEKSLFEGGAWITDNGEILRHVDGNTLWFSSMTSEEQPQPAYAQQIECQFCDDDLIIIEGRKLLSLKVVFSGKGTTSYQDSHYEFDIDYTFDKPLEYRHYFGHDSEVISGQATIHVSDRSGQINDQVTAIYSQHNDIKTTVKHLR